MYILNLWCEFAELIYYDMDGNLSEAEHVGRRCVSVDIAVVIGSAHS